MDKTIDKWMLVFKYLDGISIYIPYEFWHYNNPFIFGAPYSSSSRNHFGRSKINQVCNALNARMIFTSLYLNLLQER